MALLLATRQTPWRFRTKRHLWASAGLAVVSRTTAEYDVQDGRPVRRRRRPMTRGLNRNHNRVVKDVFKSAATAAATRRGPLQAFYQGMHTRGMREELARVTLTRKLAALTLHVWKTGEPYDATRLTTSTGPARYASRRFERSRCKGVRPRRDCRIRDVGAGDSLILGVCPAHSPPRSSPNHRRFRSTRKSVRPTLAVASQIEPWFAPRDPRALHASDIGTAVLARRMMPKKAQPTARRSREHRLVSPVQDSGLSVRATPATRSASTKCALDTRSHRTPCRSAASGARDRLDFARCVRAARRLQRPVRRRGKISSTPEPQRVTVSDRPR